MAVSTSVATFLVLTLCITTASVAQTETIDDIVRSLSARSEGLKTLQVEWKGDGFWSKTLSFAHGEDRSFASSGKVLWRSTGQRRVELTDVVWSEPDQTMYPRTLIVADDGTGEKSMFTRGVGGFPVLSIGGKKESSSIRQLRFLPVRLAYWPLDPAIGVCDVKRADALVKEGLLAERRHLIAQFGEEQIWLDPSRDLLPVRHYEYRNGTLKVSTEVEYKQVDGRWQPVAWTVTSHDGDKPRLSFSEKVTSLTWNPDLEDSAFALEPLPESWLTDYASKSDYIVRKDGSKRLIKPGEYNGSNFQEMLQKDD